MWGVILIIIAVIAIYISTKSSKEAKKAQEKQQSKTELPPMINEETSPKAKDYSQSYQKKYLLTKNEYLEYKKLKSILDKHEMIICPKVRLLDLIEPRKGDGFMSALGKIQSKHVDFVICDKNLYVKGIIELDDNSHNQTDRQERDRFINEVLQSVGYNVIHVRAITEETIKELLPVPGSLDRDNAYTGNVYK